jgi:hypothetical protein
VFVDPKYVEYVEAKDLQNVIFHEKNIPSLYLFTKVTFDVVIHLKCGKALRTPCRKAGYSF